MTETAKQNLSILIITLLLAGSLFLFFNYIKPGIKDKKDLELNIKEEQRKIELLQEYKAKADSLVQKYNEMGEDVNKINLALPSKAETAQVLATLNAISGKNKISFDSLSFQEGKSKDLPYLEIKTSFTTTYDNFKKWLDDIEKDIRITDIRKVDLQFIFPSSSTSGSKSTATSSLKINVVLRYYYLE